MTVLLRLIDIVDGPNTETLVIIDFTSRSLLDEMDEKTRRADAVMMGIGEDPVQIKAARRLQPMHSIGPIAAMAVEAFASPIEPFQRGRDFVTWRGKRISKTVDHRRHVTPELEWDESPPRGTMARPICGTQTAQACYGSVRREGGSDDLSHVGKYAELSRLG